MNALEGFAVAFGILSVWLSTREHLWSWPTALVNVSLYFVVFARAKLYADMGLQVVYFVLSLYGWYQWRFGGARRSTLHVSRLSRRTAWTLVALVVLCTTLLATILSRLTDAALPWVDSFTTSTSLAAQWMMTRKILENWVVWAAVDVVYVGMFLVKSLHLTAALYAGFFVLALLGHRSWRRSLEADRATAATVAA
jgi:nicotinamide mononucleotide transporter